jgi:5-methylthioribose kinase
MTTHLSCSPQKPQNKNGRKNREFGKTERWKMAKKEAIQSVLYSFFFDDMDSICVVEYVAEKKKKKKSENDISLPCIVCDTSHLSPTYLLQALEVKKQDKDSTTQMEMDVSR